MPQRSCVIPERASCILAVRASEQGELACVVNRVTDCAHAAALASGTGVTIETGMIVESVRVKAPLARLVGKHLTAEGADSVEQWNMLGSTDFGNVSNALPALLFFVKTWPEGTVLHSREAADLGAQPAAYAAMLTAMRVMAASALELILDADALRNAHADFRRTGAGPHTA